MKPTNYELALELKKQGFPQYGKGEWLGKDADNIAYYPTTDELLDTISKEFKNFSLTTFNRPSNENEIWWQAGSDDPGAYHIFKESPQKAMILFYILSKTPFNERLKKVDKEKKD